jgi:uncharacterized coiled-coil protein SlyX
MTTPMATKLAQSQLAELPERVSILETKVENINEKLVDIKADVKEMHDCLDNTRDLLASKLEKMQEEYRIRAASFVEHVDKLHAEDQVSHKAMDGKIKDLEQFRMKGIYLTAGAIAALGWVSGHSSALLALFK